MSGWNYTDAESDGKDEQKPQVSSLLRSRGRGRQSSAETGWLTSQCGHAVQDSLFIWGVTKDFSYYIFKKSLQVLQMLLLKNLSNPQITFYPFL